MDNLNPTWVKSFDVQYHFERRDHYKVDVYDVDDEANVMNLAGHDFVGSLEFSIHEVVTGRDRVLERPLVNTARAEGRSGIIKITGEERSIGSKEEVEMVVRSTFPTNTGFNFFLIHKLVNGRVWKPIYKSEIQQARNGAFEWASLSLLTSDLAGEDVDREIRFDFFASQKSGKHRHLGQSSLTLANLKEGTREYPVTDKQQRPLGNNIMQLVTLEIKERATFLDYIFGGCEIGLICAIDFTGSNGDPSRSSSLHYKGDLARNEYLNAIKSVGNILQYYDTDKQIPALGYGAVIQPHGTSHCFAVNGNMFDPECDGLDGVVESYIRCINNVKLSGPTNFAPIIEKVNDMTEQMEVSQQNQKYNILLIITDG